MSTQKLLNVGSGLVTAHSETVDRLRSESGDLSPESCDYDQLVRYGVEPFRLAQEVDWIVDELHERGTSPNSLKESLDELQRTNEQLRHVFGETLESALEERFHQLYDGYPHRVCTAFDFEPVPEETTNDIDMRDVLQFLHEMLDIDDEAIVEGIRVGDAVLRCKYKQNAELVEELNLEQEYKPDRYWWRHSDKVLKDP